MHAEIAGAGFAGLTAAVALRQRGWTVRLHEKGPELRASVRNTYGIMACAFLITLACLRMFSTGPIRRRSMRPGFITKAFRAKPSMDCPGA